MLIGVPSLDHKFDEFTKFHSMPWVNGGTLTALRGEIVNVPITADRLDNATVLNDGSRVYFDANQGAMIRAYIPSKMQPATESEYAADYALLRQ